MTDAICTRKQRKPRLGVVSSFSGAHMVTSSTARSLRGARAAIVLSLLAGLFAPASPAGAQSAPAPAMGRIVGRVVDAASGRGISDAGVQVVGTTGGITSGLDGRFTLVNVPAGTVTIQVRRIGYAPKTVTGLMLA